MSRLNKSFIIHLWGSKSQGRLFLKGILRKDPIHQKSEIELINEYLIALSWLIWCILSLRRRCPGGLGPGHDGLWPLPSLQGQDSCVLWPIRRLSYSLSANQRPANMAPVIALKLFNVKCLGEMIEDDLSTVWPWPGQTPMMTIPGIPSQHQPQPVDSEGVQLSLTTTATVNHSSTSFLIVSFSKQLYWLR